MELHHNNIKGSPSQWKDMDNMDKTIVEFAKSYTSCMMSTLFGTYTPPPLKQQNW